MNLIEKLRERRVTRWVQSTGMPPKSDGFSRDALCVEAADEIERLTAERDALRLDAERAVGKTAARCVEMAMWPQGLDDEQAYYGKMFAEFITKEFGAAIDAAMKEMP